MKSSQALGSFRDPSGFVYTKNRIIYRGINFNYKENYEYLINSGLYKKLTDLKLLIPHKEIRSLPNIYKTIKPFQVPFISYPYEWCFSQLKDAALTTLKIQKKALEYGMILKDASSYNIQFFEGKPILIDTLSFEKYKEGQPWIAYRQFCMHFLSPLLLMKYKNIELNKLLQIYIDGIQLSLISNLLPKATYLSPSIFTHIHLHSNSERFFADKKLDIKKKSMTKVGLLGLIDNLESIISGLNLKPAQSHWTGYYKDFSYSRKAFDSKRKIVRQFLHLANPKIAWDLGANTGQFSHMAASLGISTISLDSDCLAIEANYLKVKQNFLKNCLPLVVDLKNPSPNIGWANKERMSLLDRGPTDCILALALIHHLRISGNIPTFFISDFLAKLCKYLIIEFVPKEDSQIQRLLWNRKDIFSDYSQGFFEQAFSKYFIILKKLPITDSKRLIYLMKKRGA